ncbi:MAG TPA: hypothetical protein VK116_07660, partial [Planctomycetota bacterium]|nr:hypothetical protein [Planctomycetota bacterium]
FDEDGEAVAENAVTLSETEGCLVIAHIRGLDGRTQEAHCVLGTPDEPAEKAKAVELPDGRRVKIDPSR